MLKHNIVDKILLNIIDKFEKLLPVFLGKIIIMGILLFVWPKIVRGILYSIKRITDKNRTDPLLISFLESFTKTLLNIILFFIIIGVLGIQTTSIVTILGAAGIAVGLALQGSLTNLASGVIILFFKNVSRGDFISANGGKIEGTVESIHILYTNITTLTGVALLVPNSQLANSVILNYSKNPERMLDLIYSTSYDDPVEKTMKLLHQVIDEEDRIIKRTDRPVVISLIKHNSSSLDFRFRVWTKKEDYFETLYACNKRVQEIFTENGIEIPYNKLDIYSK